MIYYYLKNDTREDIKITITDPYGKQLDELNAENTFGDYKVSGNAGINRVLWNMTFYATGKRPVPRQPAGAAMMRFRGRRNLVKPGEYVITLTVGDKTFKQIGVILEDTEQTMK